MLTDLPAGTLPCAPCDALRAHTLCDALRAHTPCDALRAHTPCDSNPAKDFSPFSETHSTMATAGTLLSDLNKDNSAPIFNQDDDLVNKILADMNVPSQQNPVMTAPPPPAGHGNRMISSPNPNTMYPHTMDPATPTAHLIGKDYPSAADFANVLHPMTPGHGHGGSAYAQAGPAPTGHQAYPALLPSHNFYNEIMAQIKQPLMVALIVLLTSLPALHVLIGHYLPSMIRIGGDLTTAGLVVKALVGGFLFWFTQRILVPLMV